MIDVAKYIRIFNPEPDDDFVTKRTSAIKAIEELFSKTKLIPDIIKLANNLSKAFYNPEKLDASIIDITEKALKKQSSAFVAEDQSLQMSICALVAALQFVNNSNTGKASTLNLSITDVFSISLWSALSFQKPLKDKPKIEGLRIEILEEARQVIHNDSISSRARLSLELKTVVVAENLKVQVENIMKVITPIINNFKTNAALDREEIDVLWWKLNNWSELAIKRYSELNEVQSAILRGIDLSRLLRRLPHLSHYRLIESPDNSKIALNGSELREQVGDILPVINDYLSSFSDVANNPAVFPLFTILANKMDGLGFLDEKRPLKEWSGRALLEGAMLNMGKFVNDGV